MKLYFAALALAALSACHHGPEADPVPDAEIVDTAAIANFATQAVYEAHPTRALVDSVDVEPAAELGRFMVHVEMTGSPEFRQIYDLVVLEEADGTLELVELVKIQ